MGNWVVWSTVSLSGKTTNYVCLTIQLYVTDLQHLKPNYPNTYKESTHVTGVVYYEKLCLVVDLNRQQFTYTMEKNGLERKLYS